RIPPRGGRFFPARPLRLPCGLLRFDCINARLSFVELCIGQSQLAFAFLCLGAVSLQLLFTSGECAFPFCKKAADHRNVGFARRQVIVRLFHQRMKLSV
ncbi:hypothetical protein TcG_12485, partial [Trypanosoma cruzi]